MVVVSTAALGEAAVETVAPALAVEAGLGQAMAVARMVVAMRVVVRVVVMAAAVMANTQCLCRQPSKSPRRSE